MAGMETLNTWEPKEIRAFATDDYLAMPCTIEKGQNLDIGQIVGERPTSKKYIAYDKDAASSTTSATAGESNTGNGTFSTVEGQDDYTLTENWEVTCTATATNGGTFSVTGSISGNVGNATVGSEFKYPNTAAYIIKFTVSDGSIDFAEGDTFTFSSTAAGARVAHGILSKDTDATNNDIGSSMYVKGNFVESKLTGLDADARSHMNGKTVGDTFFIS